MDDENIEKYLDPARITAILVQGVKQLRPAISRVNSASATGGSYLSVKYGSGSVRIPMPDNSRARTTMGRFR